MKRHRILAAIVVAAFLTASVSTAHAGPSGTDWLWLAPVIVLGASLVIFTIAAIGKSATQDEQKPGNRPRRGLVADPPAADADYDDGEPAMWYSGKCTRSDGMPLICW